MTAPDLGSIVLLGSTGSIGTQALEVLERLGALDHVVGLAAGGSHLQLLAEQVVSCGSPRVAVATERAGVVGELRQAIDRVAERMGRAAVPCQIFCGPQAIVEMIDDAHLTADDTVVNGITGSVGLKPTLAALATGARLALANKESLVVGGALVKQALRRPGQVVPVDSEHSAIAQALASGRHEKGLTSARLTGHSEVRRLILTASGGPFRGRKRSELAHVTAEQALAHPTWSMGPVVTVNSSTLINKGLELIEAHLLFDVDPSDIVVTVHPQSIVHSMVEFIDGATIAQASPPDMRLPIALGLTWPERPDLSGLVRPHEWSEPVAWEFEPLDDETFPAVGVAREAVAASGTHPAVLNAANEETVAAFLDGALAWADIVDIDAAVLSEHEGIAQPSLTDVLNTESWARERARELINQRRRA